MAFYLFLFFSFDSVIAEDNSKIHNLAVKPGTFWKQKESEWRADRARPSSEFLKLETEEFGQGRKTFSQQIGNNVLRLLTSWKLWHGGVSL